MKNRLCELLGMEKPIIQGPMSWVSTAPLVTAVLEAGAFGVLGTAVAPPEFIESQVKLVREKTDKPFAINMGFLPFILGDEYFDAVLAILKKYNVPAVHLDTACDDVHRIDPGFASKCFTKWHENGIKVIAKVFTMEDAHIAEDAGADAIIVKGWEGGGHTTMQTTMILVPQAADEIKVPVIASGGIADGRGMAAALMLGADGIEMGTVFLAAEETDIHASVKQAVVEAKDFSTIEIGTTTPMPCRQLRNDLSAAIKKLEAEVPAAEAGPKVMETTQDSLRLAMKEGDLANGAVMAGMIVGLVKEIRPVKDIIDSTLAQCEDILKKAPATVLR